MPCINAGEGMGLPAFMQGLSWGLQPCSFFTAADSDYPYNSRHAKAQAPYACGLVPLVDFAQ